MVVIHRVSKSPKAGKDHEHSEIRQGHHGTVATAEARICYEELQVVAAELPEN